MKRGQRTENREIFKKKKKKAAKDFPEPQNSEVGLQVCREHRWAGRKKKKEESEAWT